MPPPWQPLPSSLPPALLYRHVLREVSYLPPAFRAPIEDIVRDRFHRHRQNDPRAKDHRSRAKTVLRTLRAANSGDKDAMQGLLSKAFARSGARRRVLLSQFVKSQGPDDSEALKEVLTDGDSKEEKQSRKLKHAFLEKWDSPKLLQALKSQKQQQDRTKYTASWPGAAVKCFEDTQFVPKRDIWGRPPTEILVRARRARWWKLAVDRLMTPLGRGEWDLLGRLSAGSQAEAEWAVPPRRRPARPLTAQDTDASAEWDWKAYATRPAYVVEKPKSLSNQRRSGQRDNGPHGPRERSSTISARWFRRAYNRVWQVTPTVSQDPNTLKYSIKWGNAPPRIQLASSAQLEFLRGAEEKINRGGGKKRKGAAT